MTAGAARDPHAGQAVLTGGLPIGRAAAAALMIHGRGAGPENILDLVPALAQPEYAYFAPTAAGRTWYPYSFLSEIPKNEPFLSSAIGAIAHAVDSIVARGLARERIVLIGFSQGACLASEFVVRHPARYGGLIAFSGGLIGPPGTTWPAKTRLTGLRAFFGCSDVDAHVPKDRVEASAAHFRAMGADVTLRIYPGMGHEVNDDEIAIAQQIMRAAASLPSGGTA